MHRETARHYLSISICTESSNVPSSKLRAVLPSSIPRGTSESALAHLCTIPFQNATQKLYIPKKQTQSPKKHAQPSPPHLPCAKKPAYAERATMLSSSSSETSVRHTSTCCRAYDLAHHPTLITCHIQAGSQSCNHCFPHVSQIACSAPTLLLVR